MCNIPKGFDEDGLMQGLAESRWLVKTDGFGIKGPITSEPENRKITPSRLFP